MIAANRAGAVGLRPKSLLQWALLTILLLFPLLTFSLKGWVNALNLLAGLLAMIILGWAWIERRPLLPNAPRLRRWVVALLLAFTLPLLSVLVSQALRGEWSAPAYDAPARLLLGGLILLAVMQMQRSTAAALPVSIPLMQLITLALLLLAPNTETWPERPTVGHVDPLMLSAMSLLGSLLCLVQLTRQPFDRAKLLLNLLNLLGLAAGLYIALATQSRTGWLAVPLVLLLLLLLRTRRPLRQALPLALFLVMAAGMAAYLSSTILQERFTQAVEEFHSYPWQGEVAPDTSIGLRLTFWRIALQLLQERPLSGWGSSYPAGLESVTITAFASPYARELVADSKFHSELGTRLVKSGLGGGVAILLLFFVPFAFLLHLPRLADSQLCAEQLHEIRLLGVTVLLCFLVTSLSTEVFNLKYVTSFFALLMSSLLGSAIVVLHYPATESRDAP